MARALANWLESYLEYTSYHEAPERIHLWTGLAVLSAAIRRQLHLDLGFYKLYPNIYVLIVAESATSRKSVAMEIGLSLLQDAIPDIVVKSGSMTPEGLTKVMNRTVLIPNPRDAQRPSVSHESHVVIYADELATLFGYDKQRASRMTILLTEIYSSKDKHSHTTSKEGELLLHNLYPTMLAATDPRNFKVLPEDAVGGLIGRMVIVTAAGRRHNTPWTDEVFTAISNSLRRQLMADLARIGSLKGTFSVTQEARALFSLWYEDQSKIKLDDPRLGAFHERCHDTARKLAMLLSIATTNDLVITEPHMKAAIAFIEKQLPEFTKVSAWAGTSVYQQNRARLLDLMRRAGGIAPRKQLLKAMMISSDEFDMLVNTLRQEDTLSEKLVGRQLVYVLSPEEFGTPTPETPAD